MGANNTQSLRRDREVEAAFTRIRGPGKVDLAECKYCKDSTTKPPFKKAWNTTRCHDHLKVCVPYIDHIDERNAPTRSRAERLQEEGSNVTTHQAKHPNKLNFKPIDDTWRIKQLDGLFAKAVYTSCCSFTFFTTPEWTAFFAKLGYTPPSERRLRIALLDDCYTDMKNEVAKVFQASRHLGIVADESTNITNHRIQNVSVMCNQTSYHWSSENLEDEEATADASVATIKVKALEITNNDLNRLSSLSTDTCNTQRSVWKKVQMIPELKHVLSIPCDSHGLQLAIKDLIDPGKDEYRCTIPSKIREFCKEYTSIISFFSGAPKQLGYLRVKQKKVSKVVALIAAGNTRWGTQVSIFCFFTSSLMTVVIASIDQIPSQEQRSPSNVLL